VFLPATKQQLVDVMRDQNARAGEAVVRILEAGNTTAILKFGSEEDLVAILKYPATAIACDCGATKDTRQHPRAWGTFPRVLGHYVRETRTLTWEDAIRKMTALPASTIGMVDRGFLAPGMAADVTIFDPQTVIDHSTYEDASRLSEGIRFVLVNGRMALRDGTPTGERVGRPLLRTRHMPTRPMTRREGKASARGTIGDVSVAIDVLQPANAAHAKGTLRIADAKTGEVMEAAEIGLLQTAENWSSFTAHVRFRLSRDEQWAVVIVDRGDPAAPNATHVSVLVDGRERLGGVLQ